MMNEFGIVYLLPDKAKIYHERLSKDIEDGFRLKGSLQLNAPSHITLKYRFKAEAIESVETAIQAFCREQTTTKWKIEGFNYFQDGEKNVIFLDIKADEMMRLAHGRLLAKLKSIDWMQWGEFDHNQLHYHVTLANKGLTAEKFEAVWEFVNGRSKPTFDLLFDHVALLKIENNIHKVYQLYYL